MYRSQARNQNIPMMIDMLLLSAMPVKNMTAIVSAALYGFLKRLFASIEPFSSLLSAFADKNK